MASNKIFRIKVNVDNDVEQILCKMGTQQCTVIEFSINDELVVYVNYYATETSAGLYMQHFGQLKDNADKIKRIVAVIARQSSERKQRQRERMGETEKVGLETMDQGDDTGKVWRIQKYSLYHLMHHAPFVNA